MMFGHDCFSVLFCTRLIFLVDSSFMSIGRPTCVERTDADVFVTAYPSACASRSSEYGGYTFGGE
jgi:hypothetical protein